MESAGIIRIFHGDEYLCLLGILITVDTPYKNNSGTKIIFLCSIYSKLFLYGVNFELLRFVDQKFILI